MPSIPEYSRKDLYPNAQCLSSSQFLRYEESPAAFYVENVLGVRQPPSQAMQIGAIFSELYRNRSFDYRKALAQCKAPARIIERIALAINAFPVIPSEIALRAEYKGWQFRATLDGFIEEQGIIVENKTGQTEWTQARFDQSDQVTFQVWVYWKKYNELPKRIICNWVDFRASSTSPIVSFVTARTKEQLVSFESRVDSVIYNLQKENFNQKFYYDRENFY